MLIFQLVLLRRERMLWRSFCAKPIDLIVKNLNDEEKSVTREECRRASSRVRVSRY
jgi:hypothetical protein